MRRISTTTSDHTGHAAMTDLSRPKLTRRLALLAPLAMAGCSTIEDVFVDIPKPPVPGIRVPVIASTRGLVVDNPRGIKVRLPPPTGRDNWPQPGGSASHEGGHVQVADQLNQAWSVSIGKSGGYRRKIPASPVVSNGLVFTIDPNGLVAAFNLSDGKKVWEFDTTPEDDDNSNIGGGISADGGVVYIASGRAEVIAVDASTGAVKWRQKVIRSGRAGPTIADGKLFVSLLGNAIVCLNAADGKRIWSYQSEQNTTGMLGLPSPAYADGLLVAGFGTGQLVGLRATTGAVVWLDSLASTRSENPGDLSAIHGLPVIQDGRVYAVSMGGLMIALDLRSGRRLWERDIASADTPWMAGGFLFVLSSDAQLTAIDRIDGSVIWVTQLEKWVNKERKRDAIFWTGPVLAGDRLVVIASTSVAQAVSPYTGEVIGEQALSGPAAVAPVVAGGTLLVLTEDGKMLALR